MTTQFKNQIAKLKRCKPTTLILPASLLLFFVLTVLYFALYHFPEWPITIMEKELKKSFPEAELMAPTFPPRYLDEKGKSWQPFNRQQDLKEREARLLAEREKAIKRNKDLEEEREALENKK